MIIFSDLSEVLIRGIYRIEKRIERVYDAETSMQFITRKSEMIEQFEYLMRGCMTENEFWNTFLAEGEWPFGTSEMKALVSHHIADEIPGTLELYSNIMSYPDLIESKNGKKIPKNRIEGTPEFWLISDHIAERREELEYLHPDIFSLFSRCIWSYDEVALKKDTAFFHRILKKNDLSPEEVIFIDDYPDNIASASKAGITTFWFRNYWQLKHGLSKKGFRFGRID